MSKLFIFAGKPGVGKTTIIGKLFPGVVVVDVLPFIETFRVNGSVPEENTILAYRNMYKYLAGIQDEKVVLEIGTNHPDLNIAEIEKLKEKYEKILILLCDATKETAFKRAMLRDRAHNEEEVRRRIDRDFPNTFTNILKDTNLNYKIVDMNGNLEKTLGAFRESIK